MRASLNLSTTTIYTTNAFPATSQTVTNANKLMDLLVITARIAARDSPRMAQANAI
jgi:hypothetical protein